MNEKDYKISKKDWHKIKNGLAHDWLKRKGYKISKSIILSSFLIPLLLIAYIGITEGWGQKWSVDCRSDEAYPCENILYSCNIYAVGDCPSEEIKEKICGEDPGLCIMPTLPIGFHAGHKPGKLYNEFFPITILVVLLAYGLNHVLFNKKEQRLRRLKK